MKKRSVCKRIISVLLVIALLLPGMISIGVSAAGNEVNEEAVMYPMNNTYQADYAAEGYIKVKICRISKEEKFLLLFDRERYTYSVSLELYEDEAQTKLIAQYRSSELKSWSKDESFEDIISHDKKLKKKKVYDLLMDIHSMEIAINDLEPVYNDPVALQEFLVSTIVGNLGESSYNAFSNALGDLMIGYFEGIQSELASSFVGTTVTCLKEIDEVKNGPIEVGFWERLLNFFVTLFTSEDKPDVPDTKSGSIFAKAMAEAGMDVLGRLIAVNEIAIYKDVYLKHYAELYSACKDAAAEKRSTLCEVIKELDSSN